MEQTMKLATFAGSILATSLVALGGAAVPSVALASPDDGMLCRSSYSGALNGTRFVCAKTKIVNLPLECINRQFLTKVIRAPGAPGDTTGGKDICTRAGIVVGSTDALTGLVLGQDFIFAAVNQTAITNAVNNADQQEATALGLTVNDVDTAAGAPTVVVNGGFGSNDVARVTLTQNTFAIPAPSLITFPGSPIVPNLPNLPSLPRP
jgi:hypothetical protein